MVPIEVSGRLIEVVPGVVDKVPSAADRVRREIVLARFLGKLAVDQGLSEIRSRLSPTESTADVPERPTPPEPVEPVVERTPAADATSPAGSSDVPSADALALADYDHLSSAQIVSKLAGLDASELDAIDTYERAGRHRRTILGKVEQLRRSEDGS